MESYIYSEDIFELIVDEEANKNFLNECIAAANRDLNSGVPSEQVLYKINHCIETGDWLEE